MVQISEIMILIDIQLCVADREWRTDEIDRTHSPTLLLISSVISAADLTLALKLGASVSLCIKAGPQEYTLDLVRFECNSTLKVP